jgi:methyl-accepting chemotaxis protein
LKNLQSEDKEQFTAMLNDINAGLSGVRIMEYEGKPALWAYGSPKDRPAFPVLIVPYDRVIELADSMEQFLLGESAQWRIITGIVLLAVFGAAVILGVVQARSFTKPITELTEAGKRLATGDFDSRVDIRTGDELQQLTAIWQRIQMTINS